MTLVNVSLTRQRAVVFTDTLASRGGAPAGPMSKIDLLPHLHAAVATRGRGLVHADALQGLNLLLPLPQGLESVPAELPQHLRTWSAIRAEEIEAGGHNPGDFTSVVCVAGWSKAERRACAWRFHSDAGFEAEPLAEGFTIEPDVAGRPMPKNMTPQQMIEAAKIQKKALDRQHALGLDDRAGPCIGGTLWCCEITFAGFTLKPVHTF